MTYTITTNPEFNSLEIFFDEKPSEVIRDALKALKFRWHSVKKCWYGYSDENTVKNAIDEKPAPISFETVEENTLYEGWKGNRETEWKNADDLKTLLQIEFKKKGYKVSIKKDRSGWTLSLHFTVTLSRSDIKPFDEWKQDADRTITRSAWLYYKDEGGRLCDIYRDNYFKLDPRNADDSALRENVLRTQYDLAIEHLDHDCDRAEYDYLTDSAVEKMKDIKNIVASFNYDKTNAMIDYFDCGFYTSYSIKFVD